MEVYLLSVSLARHRAIVPLRRLALPLVDELDARGPRGEPRDLAGQAIHRTAPTGPLQQTHPR